ncbi:hypothetical protein RAS1_24810 [Phycisphaerae bacterium RAS1]|nr:hypothetical protein RAS1_24810 [Phycisphaerae bacterium RAS1]
MNYTLSVEPKQAILGARIEATLRCHCPAYTRSALTLEHKSLTLELRRLGAAGGPAYALPNRKIAKHAAGMDRIGTSGGVETLSTGEERFCALELTRHFASQLLNPGEYEVSFTLSDGQRTFRSAAARLVVQPRRESVPLLLDWLMCDDLSARTRAAQLLQRMTGAGFEYDPAAPPESRQAAAAAWRASWDAAGSQQRWDAAADGASVAGRDLHPPVSGDALGGVVFDRAEWSAADRTKFLEVLHAWRTEPQFERLRAARRAGDLLLRYPADSAKLAPDTDMQAELTAALGTLSRLADSGADAPPDALVILSTVAAAPDANLCGPLRELAETLAGQDSWQPVRTYASGLLNWLTP